MVRYKENMITPEWTSHRTEEMPEAMLWMGLVGILFLAFSAFYDSFITFIESDNKLGELGKGVALAGLVFSKTNKKKES